MMMMTISLEVAALPTERRDQPDGAGDHPQRKKRPSVEYLLVFEALRSEDWANYGDQIKELAEEATMIRGDYSPEAEQRRLELSEQHRNLLDMRSYMGSDMPIFKAITQDGQTRLRYYDITIIWANQPKSKNQQTNETPPNYRNTVIPSYALMAQPTHRRSCDVHPGFVYFFGGRRADAT